MVERNWSGNLTYAADRVVRPGSIAELRDVVASAPRVKALGTRHCFNDVADFPGGVLVDLSALVTPPVVDRRAATVTIGAATRYGDLAATLHAAGFALPNLASLPHCTVAGSVATGTHGSGRRNGGLATAVSAVELLTADGGLRTYSRAADGDVFGGLVVNLGAHGVVTSLTLDLVPAFDVRQDVFDRLPWDAVTGHFDEIQGSAYSVSLFTNWRNDTVDQALLKSRVDAEAPPRDFFGAVPADGARHPAHAAGVSAENTTAQGGVPGPWYDRIPHFRLDFTPSMGDELQSEFFVPREHAEAVIGELRGLGAALAPVLLVGEIRAIAADDHWLSPAQGRDTVAFHFTWRPRQAEVEALLPTIEDRLAPFGARPHWGKLFRAEGGLDALYPRLGDFRALCERLDPGGTFRSPYVRRNVFGER